MTAGSLTAPARSAPVQQKSPQICGLFTIARDFPRAAATAARSGPDPPLRSRVIDDRVVGTRVRFLPLDKHILVVLCEPGDVAARVGAVAWTQRARSVAGESPVVQCRIIQCEYVHLMPPLQRADACDPPLWRHTRQSDAIAFCCRSPAKLHCDWCLRERAQPRAQRATTSSVNDPGTTGGRGFG